MVDDIKINYRNKIDGIRLLRSLDDATVSAAFFDPQYRGILDKLAYGNEGKNRAQTRCALPQMGTDTIRTFIVEISRVLKPSGHLFLWVDKYHLCEGVSEWLIDTDLKIVDMVVWVKPNIGMGFRTRRKSEYIIVIQKKPIRAKGVWQIHNIPDVWNEKVEKIHPHSKPVELQKALINAVTNEGDLVLDPASGGYSVMLACKQSNRNFVGGDIVYGDN